MKVGKNLKYIFPRRNHFDHLDFFHGLYISFYSPFSKAVWKTVIDGKLNANLEKREQKGGRIRSTVVYSRS